MKCAKVRKYNPKLSNISSNEKWKIYGKEILLCDEIKLIYYVEIWWNVLTLVLDYIVYNLLAKTEDFVSYADEFKDCDFL